RPQGVRGRAGGRGVSDAETTERFMRRAIELAEHGRGLTLPNPMVGAVVVTPAGEVVGEGFHAKAGGPHAEVEALRAAGARARGATIYVTLEPCSHHGRTSPCAVAVVEAGVTRVVAALTDPNPLVSGRGIAILRGVGTVLRDDPELTVRLDRPWPREPLRVVLDTAARTPREARLIRAGAPERAVIVVGANAPDERTRGLATAGASVVRCRTTDGRVSLESLLAELFAREVRAVLVEGGGEVQDRKSVV